MAIEIVTPGRIPDSHTHLHGECKVCGCVFNVGIAEGPFKTKPLDMKEQTGGELYMECPTCKKDVTLKPGKIHKKSADTSDHYSK